MATYKYALLVHYIKQKSPLKSTDFFNRIPLFRILSAILCRAVCIDRLHFCVV